MQVVLIATSDFFRSNSFEDYPLAFSFLSILSNKGLKDLSILTMPSTMNAIILSQSSLFETFTPSS